MTKIYRVGRNGMHVKGTLLRYKAKVHISLELKKGSEKEGPLFSPSFETLAFRLDMTESNSLLDSARAESSLHHPPMDP